MDNHYSRSTWEDKVDFTDLSLPGEQIPWDSKNPILLMLGDENFSLN